MEIALHVDEKNGHVDEVVPAGAAGFEYGAHVAEYRVYLSLEVEFRVIPRRGAFQAGHTVRLRIARADTG